MELWTIIIVTLVTGQPQVVLTDTQFVDKDSCIVVTDTRNTNSSGNALTWHTCTPMG